MSVMDSETENRFVALETKLAYMEDFMEKLQEEAVAQSRQIEILRKENQILADRYKELLENTDVPNRRPPHY
ncbi:MAG: SlyX family protein [Treponema sp.]|nr:SlyX family protein [Treponema sp.]